MSARRQAAALITLALIACTSPPGRADWPTVRGGPGRTGRADPAAADVRPPFRLARVRHFENERLGSAMEPVVAGGKVFVATHGGNVYALDAGSGDAAWRFEAGGAFLHSPAFDGGRVVAACTDGSLYCLDAESGRPLWSVWGGRGGFAASPLVADGVACAGSRAGEVVAMELESGRELWRSEPLEAPIRQTAAAAGGRVFITGEDMRLRCLDLKGGELLWTSDALAGQTARDYYPVVAESGGRPVVVVRTNPAMQFSERIGRDRAVLCEAAGVDCSGWEKLHTWTQDERALGDARLWEKEAAAVDAHLSERSDARTMFVLDAKTGDELKQPPVYWAAGCQGVGTPPVVLDGEGGGLFVVYRSAYGNWNQGVAPLVPPACWTWPPTA